MTLTTVRLPSLLQSLTGGASSVEAEGTTLRLLIADLERQYPGLRSRVVDENSIRDDILVAVGGDEVRDLDTLIPEGAEVYILPAIAGG